MNPKYFWEELSDVLDTEPNIPPVIPIIEFNVRPLGILPVTLNPILVTRDMSGKTTDRVIPPTVLGPVNVTPVPAYTLDISNKFNQYVALFYNYYI